MSTGAAVPATPFLNRLAAAPISWGICEVPGWGAQLAPERVLDEMSELGFATTELGAAGYLPEDPAELRDLLARHDLTLCGAFIPVVVHDASEAEATRTAIREAAELLGSGRSDLLHQCTRHGLGLGSQA